VVLKLYCVIFEGLKLGWLVVLLVEFLVSFCVVFRNVLDVGFDGF